MKAVRTIDLFEWHMSPPKGASLAENVLFDVLIDKIRPAVFTAGDDKKKWDEKGRKVHKVT